MARKRTTIEAELAKVTADHTAAAERTEQLANQRAVLMRELEAAQAAPAEDEPSDETK